ncbi:PDR/VanB family oxidoreductase [Rhizobium sp. 9140]|uniref:PDR/VanB family oxidoreductase n=1 Tax=Rhizobium sp. 9140 TaxID=1761900 RepID=UPI0007995C64|nr:PDR/VanB family oxidoreductase [Rhizobium sp. 9140]CZT37142.1 vanillate O-demethylase ferredoxin subunit [Rhizobium sp. 9140]
MIERFPVRIERINRETADIVSLDLVSHDTGVKLPRFEPGAHIDVDLGPNLVRPYSLCGNPDEEDVYRIGVLKDRASRGGSEAVHRLHPGDVLKIGAPRNLFPLVRDADRAVLLAGGIGITPLLSMAHALHARGVPFGLHYFTRDRHSAAFLPLIEAVPFAANVTFHFCDETSSAMFDARRDLPAPSDGLHLYTCGPEGFMVAVTACARAQGYRDDTIHQEHFHPLSVVGEEQDREFTVVDAATGREYRVPKGRSIARVLVEAGLDLELSCEQGMCGTCLVDVLEGEPEHHDIYQTDAEKASNLRIAVCCSRSRSTRLVLDL